METIRPDKDDLLAHRSRHVQGSKRPTQSQPDPGPRPPRRSRLPWLLLLIILVAAGVAVWWGAGRIQTLHQEMVDTQAMIKESRLSLARFEGRLTQTGQALQKSDSSVGKTLEQQTKDIQSLWHVVRNQNAQAIAANNKAVESHAKAIADQGKAIASIRDQVASLNAPIKKLGQQIDDAGSQIATLKAGLAQNTDAMKEQSQSVAELQKSLGQLHDNLTARIQRMGQEQQLANQDLQARLDKLKQQLAGDGTASRLKKLEGQLTSVRRDIKAIDASRSQLTARLLRLDRRVQALADQMASRSSGAAKQ